MASDSNPLSESTSRLSISGPSSGSGSGSGTLPVAPVITSVSPIASSSNLDVDTSNFTDFANFQKPQKRKPRRQSNLSTDSKPKLHKRKQKKIAKDENAKPVIKFFKKPDRCLKAKQIRDLVLLTLGGTKPNSNVIGVEYPENVKKVVVCFVGGLRKKDFIENDEFSSELDTKVAEKFPFLAHNFDQAYSYEIPHGPKSLLSIQDTFASISVKKNEFFEKDPSESITIHDLLLLRDSLLFNNYPMHSSIVNTPTPEGWVETKDLGQEKSHIYAMDCEFCQAAEFQVLTRISIVNFEGETVLDSFVKPDVPIIDYVTKFSGITEEILEKCYNNLA